MNISMQSTGIGTVPIDAGLEHRRRVIYTVTSEFIGLIAQSIAFDITMCSVLIA